LLTLAGAASIASPPDRHQTEPVDTAFLFKIRKRFPLSVRYVWFLQIHALRNSDMRIRQTPRIGVAMAIERATASAGRFIQPSVHPDWAGAY
jgi:hypothetical protein